MTIIKEFCGKRVILRPNHYNKSLAHILELVNEARKDFDINPENVTITHYGGQRYKGTMGIEFDTDQAIPAEYREISQVEFTL